HRRRGPDINRSLSPAKSGEYPAKPGEGGPATRGPHEACFVGWEVGGVPGEAGGGGSRDPGSPRSLLRGVGSRGSTRRSRGRGVRAAGGPREAGVGGGEGGGVRGEAGGGGPRDPGPPRSLLRGVGCRGSTRRSRGRGVDGGRPVSTCVPSHGR